MGFSSLYGNRACSPLSKSYGSFCTYPFHQMSRISLSVCARKTKRSESESQPILKRGIVEEVAMEDEEDDLLDELGDEEILDEGDDVYEDDLEIDDGDDFIEELEMDEAEPTVGDGGEGGGISLAGTWWDKKALAIAEEVAISFDGDLGIYAFKTSANGTIKVRIEALYNKSGSPTMEDVEAFSTTYKARLDEAGSSKLVPDDIYLEVSSPGVERIVRIPDDFDRFMERSMYVKYAMDAAEGSSPAEADGIFKLISFDMETKSCTWGLADVKVNRAKAGKGRPLSKKQKEWRLITPFDSLVLVRLYCEF